MFRECPHSVEEKSVSELALNHHKEEGRFAGRARRTNCSIRSLQFCFSYLVRSAVALSMGVLLIGCSTRVEYFADDVFPARDKQAPVEWLPAEPSRPHLELARITMSHAFVGEERLRQMIAERARALGADAVLDDGVTRDITPGAPPYYEPALMGSESPYYEAGLLGPKGAAFGLYGYGWYSPFSSNPFILSQGATDQPKLAKSLSGVAIRYQPDSPKNELPQGALQAR